MDFKETFDFLRGLQENNNKEWFDEHRPTYQKVRKDFEGFVQELIGEIAAFEPAVADQEAKRCVFRIFRDVRFSKNKVPYKTNFGAFIAPDGRKSPFGGYYLHIEPNGKSMIGGGIYCPASEVLAKVRQEIDYSPQPLLELLGDKGFQKEFGGLWDGDRLKTAPKGYPKDHEQIELLRNKSFIAMHEFADEEVLDKDFRKKVIALSQQLKPLNDYLNTAIRED